MHVLTIDTEHEPGSVAIVEVDDGRPDVQRTAIFLGTVGNPNKDERARHHAQDLAADAGWLVSSGWELTTDAYVAPVTAAVAQSMSGVADPLGLERCAVCGNAFGYEADETATYRWRRSGRSGFVCYRCTPELDDVLLPSDLST